MVKRDLKTSISEDGEDAAILNENGKRPADDQNKDTKKRIKTKSLYRQPTVNELNRLQETENLFNSNLFRLQVEEILQEVQIKEKTEKRFQQWFADFKIYLESIPNDDTEYDLSEQKLEKKLKVKLPVSNELSKTRCMFKFYKFKDVRIVGSYSLGCSINSKLRMDLQISVPSDTYTKNDSINYRYHKKRAAYLAFIAAHLSKLDSIQDLQYSWVNGSETKPVLDFKPSGKLGNHLSVRLNIVCEEESYKLHRFSPVRNNVREAWLFSSEGETSDVGPPTPYYNSTVLSDLTAEANQELLNEVLLKSENLKQAIILLKIWLRQRDLPVAGHVINLIITYFVQNKRINNIMSSYQIVRNVWIALKTSEWDTKGISLHKGTDTPSLEEFHQHYPVVFIDKTGYYNICWQMSKGIYYALRRESALAVDMLDNPKINSFLPLFMIPVKPLMKFDHILRFKNLENLKNAVISKSSKESRLYYGLDTLALVTETVLTLLMKGLGNRAELIQPLVDADFSWPVKKKPVKEGYEEKVSFGLIYNTDHALNAVEKGPPANLPEAEEFRAFWGDKSELRRFQDGSITETCVWEAETAADRRGLTKQIINYLLELKFGIPESSVYHVCDQLEGVLVRRRVAADAAAGAEEAAARGLRAFDDLRRDLRHLADLPLNISAVYGVSSVFSYSDPLPPLPRAPTNKPWRRGDASLIKTITKDDGTPVLPEYVPVCKAVIELGHSGKWPGDIQAFRCLKAAFHLQISDRLREQYSLPAQAYPTHVDVLKNGLVFRLAIAHPKEITLLRREIDNGVVKHIENEESVNLQRDTVLLPRLRGALHGLHQKYPAFGPTACLVKRWVSAHLLAGQFPGVAAELLCAAVFVQPAPATPPAAPSLAFLRVLELLARTDWNTHVIVLDFNEDMTREEISELERKLSSEESGPRLRIVTAYDDAAPAIWTAAHPTAPVLARVTALASSALQYAHQQTMEGFGEHLLGAFVPSLSGFDVVLHVWPALVPLAGERLHQRPAPRRLPADTITDHIPVVEFHPVRNYLNELRNAYSDFALFFHDEYGGVVIAVLWKPDIHELKDFQVANAHALMPVTVDGETKYKVNTAALVEDFRILGEGLVKDITVNS